MRSKAVWWFLLTGALAPAGFGQNARPAPVAKDPLELVKDGAAAVDAAARADATALLDRARSSYALRGTGRAFDVKVTFTVNSGGATEHDGTWQMEDIFDPRLGLRWTARSADGYAITRISTGGRLYGEESGSYVPLRLHEARAALFDPMPTAEHVNRGAIRTATAVFEGMALTCVMLSAGAGGAGAAGRRWDESEECIDPQTGLLRTHSQAPGRYYAYEYDDALQLAGHRLPRRVTITEGGRTVTTLTVESLTELPGADASLFAPTAAMESRGRPEGLGGAQKAGRNLPAPAGGSASTVCVFGVMTPEGQLMEAHSLQPADPNSAAAVAAVRQMSFPRTAAPGPPQQYFLFVTVRFGAAR